MGLQVRLSLALNTIQVTVRFSSEEFPEGMIDGDTTYLHLHNFCMEAEGEENILKYLHSSLSPQDYGPTKLTSTYSVCTRRVFDGIGHRILGVSVQTDHLIGTSAHALQRQFVTYTGMGTVSPGPHELLRH
ncbi:hypothetical protein TNCV_2225751 [Trichonephila clavipes]|nr:hypothetical protein TNCV_2225751 [Trichonephila clavipes]